MATNNNKNKVQVNIIGDNEGLDESLKDSEAVIEAFGKKVTQSLQGVIRVTSDLTHSFIDAFTRSAEAVAQFTLNVKDSANSIELMGDAWQRAKAYLEAFGLEVKELILQNRSLSKTIELTGTSAGYSSQSLQKFAEHLELTTRYSADASKGAMQLIMHFRNIHGEQFLAATKSAQDLATELRTDLNSAAQLVGESLNDPITALERLAAVNIFFTKQEENMIKKAMEANKVVEAQDLILQKLVKSFGGAAKEAGDTFYGKLDRLRNLLQTIGTRVGEAVYNKINRIMESLTKGRRVFDVIIEKISLWGRVAVAVVDDITDKIANFVIKSKDKIFAFFNWLVDKTLNVAFTIPQAFHRAVDIVHTLNTFMHASFIKTWGAVSDIFTKVLPASYKYMKDVFSYTIQNITRNSYIFWLNFKEAGQTAFHNIWIELLKLKNQIVGWFSIISDIYDKWSKGLITSDTLKPLLEAAITGDIDTLQGKLKLLGTALLNPFESAHLAGVGLRTKETLENMKKQTGALDSYKKDYKSLTDLMANMNLQGNFPEFPKAISGLQTSLDLTKEWGALLSGISGTLNKDFDTVDDKVKNLKSYFEKFVKDVQEKTEALAEPALEIENKRREDEKKNNFSSKVVTGLEEFWYKSSNTQDKNTRAIEENTKTLKEQKEAREKEFKDNRDKLKKQQDAARRKYLEDNGKLSKDKKQDTLQELARKDKVSALQRRVYGISDADLDRLKELQEKYKQARARGGVLSTEENKEILQLEDRKRSREILMRNINNEELRKNSREKMLENARKRREERLGNMANRDLNTPAGGKSKFSSPTTTSETNTRLEKADMKSAMKDANKDSVSELKQVAKNTEKFVELFKNIGAV